MKFRLALAALWTAVAVALLGWPRTAPGSTSGPMLAVLGQAYAGWSFSAGSFENNLDISPSEVRRRFDDAWSRNYLDAARGAVIEVEVFYAGSRRPGNRLTHRDLGCYYTQAPVFDEKIVPIAGGEDAVRLRLRDGATSRTLLYWYQSVGATSAGNWPHLIHLYMQELFGRRTDGCLVKMTVQDDGSSHLLERQLELAGRLHADVTRWLSERVPVAALERNDVDRLD